MVARLTRQTMKPVMDSDQDVSMIKTALKTKTLFLHRHLTLLHLMRRPGWKLMPPLWTLMMSFITLLRIMLMMTLTMMLQILPSLDAV